MCRLAANTFVSLDGILQTPGVPDEDRTGGFSLGGWSVNYWDDAMGQAMAEASDLYELLLGHGDVCDLCRAPGPPRRSRGPAHSLLRTR
jgi:hypothetical protein